MNKAHVTFGSVALVLYLILFTAGLSRDSAPYRAKLLGKRTVASGETSASDSRLASDISIASAASSAEAQDVATSLPAPFSLEAFLGVMFLYTPTNVAFLTLLAGFLGGCASNITFDRALQKDDRNTPDLPLQSVVFRTENPGASMFRSFLVYLGFMAGVYITTSTPFEHSSPDQYVRFAATLSFFAFVVGYDPTKFRDWIDLLPKPPSKR